MTSLNRRNDRPIGKLRSLEKHERNSTFSHLCGIGMKDRYRSEINILILFRRSVSPKTTSKRLESSLENAFSSLDWKGCYEQAWHRSRSRCRPGTLLHVPRHSGALLTRPRLLWSPSKSSSRNPPCRVVSRRHRDAPCTPPTDVRPVSIEPKSIFNMGGNV